MDKISTYARALWQLNQAGLLSDHHCKKPIKAFIRQASETANYHTTTHYRSKGVEEALKGISFTSAAKYHKHCSREFTHDHIVPVEAVYQMLLNSPDLTVERIEGILRQLSFRATVLKEEDKRLLKSKMPKEFYEVGSQFHHVPLARYTCSNAGVELIKRSGDSWV